MCEDGQAKKQRFRGVKCTCDDAGKQKSEEDDVVKGGETLTVMMGNFSAQQNGR